MGADSTSITTSAAKPTNSKQNASALPDSSYSWGITAPNEPSTRDIGKDHPVHKIPLKKQEKMRAKGINPVLKAEMDEATKGQGGFWSKLGMTSLGGGWIK